MNTSSDFRILLEKLKARDVEQIKLPVAQNSLEPVLSEDNIKLHYGVLYKNYVKKSLAGEGEFQTAGARLHTLFFQQFQTPKSPNKPTGSSLELINKQFGDYNNFKDKIIESALSIQGSGWVYLSISGKIKTIPNHRQADDIAMILDMWEHAFISDYGADKKKYLTELLKIINWDVVNERLDDV